MKTLNDKKIMRKGVNIYFDYAATTPVDPRVLKSMLPYFSKKFGNPASMHFFGKEAYDALEESRIIIANSISADSKEIYFTGSATESNNWALKGIIESSNIKNPHLIVSSIEHDCILNTAKYLQSKGIDVTFLKNDEYGLIDLNHLKSSIKENTVMVSIIHANNEIGTIQDLEEISKICKEKGILFHTDASQSFTKIPINVKSLGIDLLTASSHKIYGPKGASFLYVRKGIKISPLLIGGGQENGMRSSTVNIPAIIGFAQAVKIGISSMKKESVQISKLRDYFIKRVLKEIDNSFLNGHPEKRLYNNINVGFLGVEGESLLMDLSAKGIAISTGSACSSPKLEPSHVLKSCGLAYEKMHGSIRISLGRWTTKQQIDYLIQELKKSVQRLRKITALK